MSTELYVLGLVLVLALVQVFLPTLGRTKQLGTKWNAGPRDEPLPPPTPLTGRLERAKTNLYETLPIFIGAVLAVHLAGRESGMTVAGAYLYLIARIVYVPLYAFGVSYVRSLAFMASMVGLVLVLLPLLGAV